MLQKTRQISSPDMGGGVNTLRNIFAIKPNETPNSMNVKFSVGGTIEKRFGSNSINAAILISTAASGFSPDSNGTLSQNLQAWWKLNEANGTRFDQYDNCNLTQVNSVLSATGVLINAASFVASSSQFLYITDTQSLEAGGSNFSVSSWFMLTSTGVRTILAKRDGSLSSMDTKAMVTYSAASDTSLLIGAGGGGVEQRAAQSFKVPEKAVISGCDIFFVPSIQGTPGPLGLTVQTDSGGIPSGILVDATSAAALITQASVANGFVHATFSGGFTLFPGTSYWLVAKLNTAPGVDTGYFWGQDTITNGYANGNAANFTNNAWTAQAAYDQLFKITGYENPQSYEYWLYVNSDNVVSFGLSGNGSTESILLRATSFGAVSTATWYNAVGWLDSTNGLAGISVNLATNSSAYTQGIVAGGSAPFVIGAAGTGLTLSAFMDGTIDETGFWDRALTTQQRIDLYNGGTANTYNKGVNLSGWGSFDFGGGTAIRWYVVAAGTSILASSNRGLTFVTIATDRSAGYQSFAFSKTQLIATSDSRNTTLVWPGSAGTFMSALAANSAQAVKFANDFSGFTFLMNSATRPRGVWYADNNSFTTDPWTTSFEIPADTDDEITGSAVLNAKLYIFTRRKVFRISPVGGNPDFSVREVKSSFGAVPRTIERVTIPQIGEVLIFLSWDKRIRIFDGQEDKVISDNIYEDNGMSPAWLAAINENQMTKNFAETDSEEQVYRLTLVLSPSTQTTHSLQLNLRTGAFYWYDNQNFATATMAQSANIVSLMAVRQDGFVYWLNTGNTDNGVPINDYYDSPFMFGQTPKVVSKTQNIDFYFKPTSSGMVYYQDRTNFNAPYPPVRDVINLTDTSSTVQVRKTIDVPLTLNVYQYRLTSSSSITQPWALNRMDYNLVDLGVGEASRIQ